MSRVVILGGGPAGLGAAHRLRADQKAEVVLLERNPLFGGNAGSFDWNGHRLDFGSHRLHPSCDPRVFKDISQLLGDDLLDRPRHGRIRLQGRWVHFPLKPLDLLLHLPFGFAAGTLKDLMAKMLPRGRANEDENFESVLEASLGRTICNDFYFPYARKIWGLDTAKISAIQAHRRVSAGSFGKLLRKVLTQVPGLKKKGSGRFFYPRQGFGQISEAYAQAASEAGAELRPETRVTAITRPEGPGTPWRIHCETRDRKETIEGDRLWSTIPLTTLAQLLEPAPPAEILEAAGAISYRSMVLIYLEVPTAQFSEFDAHYFPGEDLRITRLSEPRNYALRRDPPERSVLCAELPCQFGDALWTLDDEGLAKLMAEDLERSGIPLPAKPVAVHTRRLPQAYPIYLEGYEDPLTRLDEHLRTIDGLLSFGRQGLFAHDNTHHALHMAYCAADCLNANGSFDVDAWSQHREEFRSHVVED